MDIDAITKELAALRDRASSLDELDAKIIEQRKVLNNLQIETERTAKHLADLRDERLNYQTALNKTRAELTAAQNKLAETEGAIENARAKILRLVG
jgi:predicted  nucleic acid-binding Zn-ribbon protein